MVSSPHHPLVSPHGTAQYWKYNWLYICMSMYTVGLHAKFLRDEISSVGKILLFRIEHQDIYDLTTYDVYSWSQIFLYTGMQCRINISTLYITYGKWVSLTWQFSVAEPKPLGVEYFWSEPEPEPNVLFGSRSGSGCFKIFHKGVECWNFNFWQPLRG